MKYHGQDCEHCGNQQGCKMKGAYHVADVYAEDYRYERKDEFDAVRVIAICGNFKETFCRRCERRSYGKDFCTVCDKSE